MASKIKIIPLFLPEDSCPFQCVFCDTCAANGKDAPCSSLGEMKLLIRQSIDTINQKPDDSDIEIAFYGGSFTYGSADKVEYYLEGVSEFIEKGLVDSIRVSTRPDCLSESMLGVLSRYHVRTIEIGIQSLDDRVLKAVKRGHTAQQAVESVKRCLSVGFEVSVHLMAGLPEQDRQSFMDTIRQIISLKPQMVRIHPLAVLRGTPLHKSGYIGRSCQELESWLIEAVYLLEKSGIRVIKLGLQPTDSLNTEGVVVSGCYHQSLKHLIFSGIYRKVLEKYVKISPGLDISYSTANESYIRGYKGCNRSLLNGFGRLTVDKTLNTNECKIGNMIIDIFKEDLYEVE